MAGRRLMEGFYSVFMRRTSVYVTFLIAGTFLAERTIWTYGFAIQQGLADSLLPVYPVHGVDYGIHKLWESNNVGKRYEDISVLGQRPAE